MHHKKAHHKAHHDGHPRQPGQHLAANSMNGGDSMYRDKGSDSSRIMHQEMPNTRMNDYMTNMYAGPHSHKGKVKMKGHTEHGKQEDALGNDYGA